MIDDENATEIYIVFIYLTRYSIQDRINLLKPQEVIPLEDIKRWAKQLVSALYACHEEAKVIHRDIKPDNMVLNNMKELVLVDFGLSKKFEGEDDHVKTIAGSCLYFAPEIVASGIKNKVIRGRQTDIWAAGVSFYYIATKVYPFPVDNIYEIAELL